MTFHIDLIERKITCIFILNAINDSNENREQIQSKWKLMLLEWNIENEFINSIIQFVEISN